METSEIRATYDGLAAAAAVGAFTADVPGEWPTAKIVAHAIATNHTLNRVGIELLSGGSPSYEGGTISVDERWLEAIIEGAGDFDGLLAYLRHSVGELLALAGRFDESTGNRTFHGTIYDGKGNILLDSEMSFSDIITRYLVGHMRDHTQQIESLRPLDPSTAEALTQGAPQPSEPWG
jgi:hypothetical protein